MRTGKALVSLLAAARKPCLTASAALPKAGELSGNSSAKCGSACSAATLGATAAAGAGNAFVTKGGCGAAGWEITGADGGVLGAGAIAAGAGACALGTGALTLGAGVVGVAQPKTLTYSAATKNPRNHLLDLEATVCISRPGKNWSVHYM